MKSFVIAISGASGSIYGVRLVKELARSADNIYLCVSRQAFSIIKMETGADWAGKTEAAIEKKVRKYYSSNKIKYFGEGNLESPVASGSFKTDGMFVVPCSMKTLSGIAAGYANNLIERAADVVIKEGRKLIVAPREMPFNAIHLENMLKLARMGVTVAPPIPAFYQGPETIDDIVDFVVGKLLDSAGVTHNLFKRWG